MKNKVEILMHPVRMKISQVLMRNNKNGLTPLEMVKLIKDVPQATLYRHIQVMLDAGVISVLKEKKVKSVSEKYYTLNEDAARLNIAEWQTISSEKKIDYVSYYQLTLLNQYQSYLTKLEEQDNSEDGATFSVVELKLNDEKFLEFQSDLNTLITKYYNHANDRNEEDIPVRTLAVTIIPES
ncbi:helix-turn-helix domain-containing protein [Cytobacillus sp. IB215316]|uniref:helix-turn-helix domain-containing protein n=1 Tax=Cytobacillus sp. IB215316 TaxID=3097354 RepID=UPI002A179BE6|nr:helix-turn-helix domain-containing protein [Cytobacillus sp. IB215316]MDX8360995.1 helix-turn-helix domain-containing protein [Cytobacillus sp. IB215316]